MMTDIHGAKVWEAEYMPFGEPVSISGIVENNLRFPGQYFDAETGLHQNGYRDYKAGIGRYLEKDPIGFKGGINPFIYTLNSPMNRQDSTGLDTWSGAGVSVGGFLIFGGTATTYGWLTNWQTGEKCYVEIRAYRLGIGLGGGVTATSLWLVNGPSTGKGLNGVMISMGVEGGLGGYVSGAPGGTIGVAEGSQAGSSGGAGIGAGFAEYVEYATTRVISCECKSK